MFSICFGVALCARCTNHAAREAGDERSRTLKRTDARGCPEKTESRGVIEAAKCGDSEWRRRLRGRQFNSAGSGNRRCGAGIDQRRRQLPGAKGLKGSIHHAHPPHLRRATFVSEGVAMGQFRSAHRTTIARALLRCCTSQPSDRRCCATIAGNLSRYDRCSVAMV